MDSKKGGYNQVGKFVTDYNLHWATAEQTTSVQHVIHSLSITAKIEIDDSVQRQKGKKNFLSDHPFFAIDISGISQ